MKPPAAILSLLVFSTVAFGEQMLREVSWAKLKAAGRLGGGEVLAAEGQEPSDQLTVRNRQPKAATVTVLTLERPPITTMAYAITGQVRYEGVEGKGYLEMWSFLPDGGRHFSRTLGTRGAMRRLTGSSGWRRFVLPFYARRSSSPPIKLVVNVVLAGRGTVVLGPVRLVQYEPGEDPLAAPGQWWGDRAGGFIGGGLGVLLGCLGAVIGTLAGRGKARGLVTGALKAMFIFGLASLAVGVAAVLDSQPYAVFYPLLLVGLLCSVLPVGLLRSVGRRYEAIELREMQAQDIA